MFPLAAGLGAVRLIGYNYASGGRGDNRKPLTAIAVFAAQLVALTEPNPNKPLPPVSKPVPSPPPPPPPSPPLPVYYRPPRPPGAALPPRPVRPPPPPLGKQRGRN